MINPVCVFLKFHEIRNFVIRMTVVLTSHMSHKFGLIGSQRVCTNTDQAIYTQETRQTQDKTSELDKYTTDWSDSEIKEDALSYFVDPFMESRKPTLSSHLQLES